MYKFVYNPIGYPFDKVLDTALYKLLGRVDTTGDLPLTGNHQNDIYVVSDNDRLYTWNSTSPSGTISDWVDVGSVSAVDWSVITSKPTSIVSDIDDAVNKRHSQGTDQGLDTGGTHAVTAEQAKAGYTHSGVVTGNPHSVTKEEVGLGNVDNVSEATIITNVKADAAVKAAIDYKLSSAEHAELTNWLSSVVLGTDGKLSLGGDTHIQFRDSAIYIHSSADGFLDLVADELVRIKSATPILDLERSNSGTYSILRNREGEVQKSALIFYGSSHSTNANEVSLSNMEAGAITLHTSNILRVTVNADGTIDFTEDIKLPTNKKVQFRDAAISIASLDDGHLDLTADTSIDLNSNVAVSGDLNVTGDINIGTIELEDDAGAVSLINLPITATPAAGTEQSYAFKIDGTQAIKMYGEADGSGGVQNVRLVLENGATIANKQNTAINTGTANVDTFNMSIADGVVWDFVVKNGVNLRAGQIYACWDSSNNVEYTEVSTADLGDTSGLELAVDIDTSLVRLRATAGSDNWSVKVIRRTV